MRYPRSIAAVVTAAAVLLGSTAATADAAPKAKAKVVKKAPARKADPCSPAEVAKVHGVKPFTDPALTFVRTDTFADTNPATPTPRRWANYRGPQVWLSTAVCGTVYRQVFVWKRTTPWI